VLVSFVTSARTVGDVPPMSELRNRRTGAHMDFNFRLGGRSPGTTSDLTKQRQASRIVVWLARPFARALGAGRADVWDGDRSTSGWPTNRREQRVNPACDPHLKRSASHLIRSFRSEFR
jgi:hypothetical protein